MNSEESASLNFYVHYNWPTGKNSIRLGHMNPKKDIKISIFATKATKKNKPEEPYTLKGLGGKKVNFEEAQKVFSEFASKGIYLMGDVFYIEVFDKNGESKKKIKLDALLKKPKNATGLTSVYAHYYFEV